MLRNSNTNNNDLLSGSALQMDIGNRSSTGVETIWKAQISTLGLRVYRSFRMTGTSLSSNKRERQLKSNKNSMKEILQILMKKTTKRVISRSRMNFRCSMKLKELIVPIGWSNLSSRVYANGRQLLHIIKGQMEKKLKHGLIKSQKRYRLLHKDSRFNII